MRALELPSPHHLRRRLSPMPVTLAGLVALLALKLTAFAPAPPTRSEEHTSELQSHAPISYAVFCLKKKK